MDVDAGTSECTPPIAPPDELAAAINVAWVTSRGSLRAALDAARAEGDPYPIYDTQGFTANLLSYAEYQRDPALIEELAALYAVAFEALETHDEAHYYYAIGPDGQVRRDQVFPLARPTRMWTYPPENGLTVGPEAVLAASQFLYAVARVVRIATEMGEAAGPELRAFVATSVPILVDDHYLRWLHRDAGAPGSFQVTGWGCNNGTFDHAEHLDHLLHRRYGTSYFGADVSASYCNAVLDWDLWIVAGVAEVLAAHAEDPGLVPLDDATRGRFETHVRLGAELFESRTAITELTTAAGDQVDGRVFDPGAFDDDEDHGYAGFTETGPGCDTCLGSCVDTCAEFPGWKAADDPTPRVAPVPRTNLGWDISHARRLVPLFDTLRRHRAVLGIEYPSDEVAAGFARQVAHGIWNGSVEAPRFATYFDGTDGWYRVNYEDRPAFGYAPGSMSADAVTCGYGLWAEFEPVLSDAFAAARARYWPALEPASLDGLMILPEAASYRVEPHPCGWSR